MVTTVELPDGGEVQYHLDHDEAILKIFGHLVIRGGMCGDRENARRPEGPGKGIVPNLSQDLGLTTH